MDMVGRVFSVRLWDIGAVPDGELWVPLEIVEHLIGERIDTLRALDHYNPGELAMHRHREATLIIRRIRDWFKEGDEGEQQDQRHNS